jgi:hypothetical protein
MALHPDVIREIESTTTPKRSRPAAPAASQLNALEQKIAMLEANSVSWSDLPKFLATAFKEVGITTTAARLDKLEARPELKYHGVWSAGKTYAENSLVTHAGSLWIAKQKTASFPGGQAEPGAWQLCCKRGHDGKDGAQR